MITPWKGGKSLACDFTLVHPLNPGSAWSTSNKATTDAEGVKVQKYGNLCQRAGLLFTPAGLDTFGAPGPAAMEFLKELFNLYAQHHAIEELQTARSCAINECWERTSMAVAKAVAFQLSRLEYPIPMSTSTTLPLSELRTPPASGDEEMSQRLPAEMRQRLPADRAIPRGQVPQASQASVESQDLQANHLPQNEQTNPHVGLSEQTKHYLAHSDQANHHQDKPYAQSERTKPHLAQNEQTKPYLTQSALTNSHLPLSELDKPYPAHNEQAKPHQSERARTQLEQREVPPSSARHTTANIITDNFPIIS